MKRSMKIGLTLAIAIIIAILASIFYVNGRINKNIGMYEQLLSSNDDLKNVMKVEIINNSNFFTNDIKANASVNLKDYMILMMGDKAAQAQNIFNSYPNHDIKVETDIKTINIPVIGSITAKSKVSFFKDGMPEPNVPPELTKWISELSSFQGRLGFAGIKATHQANELALKTKIGDFKVSPIKILSYTDYSTTYQSVKLLDGLNIDLDSPIAQIKLKGFRFDGDAKTSKDQYQIQKEFNESKNKEDPREIYRLLFDSYEKLSFNYGFDEFTADIFNNNTKLELNNFTNSIDFADKKFSFDFISDINLISPELNLNFDKFKIGYAFALNQSLSTVLKTNYGPNLTEDELSGLVEALKQFFLNFSFANAKIDSKEGVEFSGADSAFSLNLTDKEYTVNLALNDIAFNEHKERDKLNKNAGPGILEIGQLNYDTSFEFNIPLQDFIRKILQDKYKSEPAVFFDIFLDLFKSGKGDFSLTNFFYKNPIHNQNIEIEKSAYKINASLANNKYTSDISLNAVNAKVDDNKASFNFDVSLDVDQPDKYRELLTSNHPDLSAFVKLKNVSKPTLVIKDITLDINVPYIPNPELKLDGQIWLDASKLESEADYDFYSGLFSLLDADINFDFNPETVKKFGFFFPEKLLGYLNLKEKQKNNFKLENGIISINGNQIPM